jgi:hypothetical protein
MKYPLTFLQESRLICEEHMWNMGRHMAPFFVAGTHLLEGMLNVAALEQSLNLVIDRHAGLRAAFIPTGGLSSLERKIKISNLMDTYPIDSDLYAQYIVDRAPLQIKVHFIESLDAEEQGEHGRDN